MDKTVIVKLVEAGIGEANIEVHLPSVPVRVDGAGRVVPLGDDVPVESRGSLVVVSLKSIPKLFTGAARAPNFARGPTDPYVLFFALIERTAIDYCSAVGKVEYDEEFQRLYNHLRRRPEGTDRNPLFSYIQAAARLYMSLHDVSRDEFEAVAQRLSLSAKHFMTGPSSTNYFRIVSAHLA